MPPRSFFERDAVLVAPDLLGAVLAHTTADGTVAVRLTEVEAYEGVGEDPGSHAHRRRTPRNDTMFGAAGHVYAYFTYGMHTCVNVVCRPAGRAAAVLLRAGQVVAGEDLARERRGDVERARLARGPANLAVALGLALTDDGADLLGPPFDLALHEPEGRVLIGPRVGVSGPGGSADFPWRFRLADEPSVSAYRPGRAVRAAVTSG